MSFTPPRPRDVVDRAGEFRPVRAGAPSSVLVPTVNWPIGVTVGNTLFAAGLRGRLADVPGTWYTFTS